MSLRLAACAAALALGIGSSPAGAATEPLFTFAPSGSQPGQFEGPCGMAVDSTGRFYVSDYYHHAVDVFSPPLSPFGSPPSYITQLANVDPIDGPCGLALDSTGKLYVNDYHRDVIRYTPSSFPPISTTTYGAALTIDSAHPTGVAVDAAGNVFVNDRTYISVYGPTGAPVEVGGSPLRIGLGSLVDGYGVAVTGTPLSAGRIYVPDAGNDTVKVYEPAVGLVAPVAVLTGPAGGFHSLRDAAIAVDRVRGDVYVADNLHLDAAERPEATIQVFGAGGGHQGHLKYNVVDALPPGLAVDNSFAGSQGRVYVTSGNTVGASVFAYGPESATLGPSVCAPEGSCPTPSGGVGGGSASGPIGPEASGAIVSSSAQPAPASETSSARSGREASARHRKRHRRAKHRHRRGSSHGKEGRR